MKGLIMPKFINDTWFLTANDEIAASAAVFVLGEDNKTLIIDSMSTPCFFDPDLRMLFPITINRDENSLMNRQYYIVDGKEYENILQEATFAGMKIVRDGWTASLIKTPEERKILKPALILPK